MYGDASLYGGTLSWPGFIVFWARRTTPTPARVHIKSVPNAMSLKLRMLAACYTRRTPAATTFFSHSAEGYWGGASGAVARYDDA
jgi:hypothetical protein